MGILLLGDGSYDFPVVGESHRQDALEAIVGGATWEGSDHDCLAILLLQDNNPYDPDAVAVGIDGHLVGYIPRGLNSQYRALLAAAGCLDENIGCRAKIVGGWEREGEDWGMFGVKLDISWPELQFERG